MPAHFLLKWQSATVSFFFDPFHEGELLDEDDCRELCKRLGVAFNTQEQPGLVHAGASSAV